MDSIDLCLPVWMVVFWFSRSDVGDSLCGSKAVLDHIKITDLLYLFASKKFVVSYKTIFCSKSILVRVL